ncbi:MAG TPA: hypothetical protein VGM39_15630 [Kofleriaceae bacterium]
MRGIAVGALFVVSACTLFPDDNRPDVAGDDTQTGTSEIANSRVVNTLTPDESLALCNELYAAFPPREVSCESGTQAWGFDVNCANTAPFGASCTATVGNARDCVAALRSLADEQVCAGDVNPPACALLEGC